MEGYKIFSSRCDCTIVLKKKTLIGCKSKREIRKAIGIGIRIHLRCDFGAEICIILSFRCNSVFHRQCLVKLASFFNFFRVRIFYFSKKKKQNNLHRLFQFKLRQKSWWTLEFHFWFSLDSLYEGGGNLSFCLWIFSIQISTRVIAVSQIWFCGVTIFFYVIIIFMNRPCKRIDDRMIQTYMGKNLSRFFLAPTS